MRRIIFLIIASFSFLYSCTRQNTNSETKILLIPLDDRPACLQFTQRMGKIGNAQVIAPPKEMLGSFTSPGKPDEIRKWVDTLDLKSFDAAIVSIDMLCYGGLVASRAYEIDTTKAIARLKFIKELKKQAPDMRVLAQNVIMRIAPTGDGKNDAYRAQLAEWGVVSVGTDKASKEKTKKLEQKIPPEVLADYKKARNRDLIINLKSIDLLKEGVVDYLLLSQDDARPQGVHVADRKKIEAKIKESGLAEKVSAQAGADEVSMLLLARLLNKKFHYSPGIKVIFSSEKMSHEVMPYEDQPLRRTVSQQIESIGAHEVDDTAHADIFFFVYTSRFEKGTAHDFVNEINKKINERSEVMVADIDPGGNVQGGDSAFAMALENKNLLPQLNSYASWNTAGNTIGTSLTQGIIFSLAQAKLMKTPHVSDKILTAQHWFTFHRMLDDFYYHNLVRRHIKSLLNQGKSANREETMEKITAWSRELMKQHFDELKNNYFGKKDIGFLKGISCRGPENLYFYFPWNRIFEAAITFDLQCHSIHKE